MSTLFIAFAVDVDKETTVLTRVCRSHDELVACYREMMKSHGDNCTILTSPSLSPMDKSMDVLDNSVLDELVVQSRIRHVRGIEQTAY